MESKPFISFENQFPHTFEYIITLKDKLGISKVISKMISFEKKEEKDELL